MRFTVLAGLVHTLVASAQEDDVVAITCGASTLPGYDFQVLPKMAIPDVLNTLGQCTRFESIDASLRLVRAYRLLWVRGRVRRHSRLYSSRTISVTAT